MYLTDDRFPAREKGVGVSRELVENAEQFFPEDVKERVLQ